MKNIEQFIQGSEKLTGIFGYWPDFHDAEVFELRLLRGEVNADKGLFDFPVLTVTIHLWEWANSTEPPAISVKRNHTLAALRFADIDGFRMEGFNYQNAMLELSIERLDRLEGPSPYFKVEIDPAFGMGASFECLRIEVVDAHLCNEDGRPTQ